MTVWGAIAGGFAGTLVMTTLLRAASELGLTRIDIPFLLGTAVSVDRTRAKVVGFALHFTAGLLFAMLYYACFVAINYSGWWIGAGFGVFHALFAGTTLVNILLPFVHPRMGTPTTAADSTPLLEPPGFMLLNYGRSTPVVNLVAHVAYGALVGGFCGDQSLVGMQVLPPVGHADESDGSGEPGSGARERQRVMVTLGEQHRPALVVTHPRRVAVASIREVGGQQHVQPTVGEPALERHESDALEHDVPPGIGEHLLLDAIPSIKGGIANPIGRNSWLYL